MQLTTKQEEGLRLAVSRYQIGMPYTVIAGYAGSGKSTLIQFIIQALKIPERQIAYVAYTGKAANVLKQKGCPNPTTAHKLLYYAKQMPNGSYTFKPKTVLDADYKLIVVDEVSMLPKDMWYLLLSHGVYVIACGDPGQLPPISKDQRNEVLDNPHIFLDEIMRQAQDSAIIRLSMHIREGKDFRTFPSVSGEVRIIQHRKDLFYNQEDYKNCLLGAGQIICGTNAQRNSFNTAVRQFLGRGDEPEIGDKVIGLTNHWDFFSEQMTALTNGAIGELQQFKSIRQKYPIRLDLPEVDILQSTILMDDEDKFVKVPIDYKQIKTGEPSLNPQQIYKLNGYLKNYKGITPPPLQPFDFVYGYAITCWKAQGSEWPNVLGFDAEWVKRKNKEEYIQYLYTLVTRSSEKIILVGD